MVAATVGAALSVAVGRVAVAGHHVIVVVRRELVEGLADAQAERHLRHALVVVVVLRVLMMN